MLLWLLACLSPAPPARVAVVGIDGGDWDVLDPLIEAGEMPNLARVKAGGAWARMNIDSPHSPVSWTSLATGRHPEGHGITLPEGMAAPVLSQDTLRTRRLWDIVGPQGRRSLVARWWLTWPAYPIAGVMLAQACPACGDTEGVGLAWPHAANEREGAALNPGALGEELQRLGLWDPRLGGAEQSWMLAEDFDLMALPFYSLDQALHMLWSEYAAARARPDKKGWYSAGDALVLQCARMADELLGRALTEVGPEGYVMVISDHGHSGRGVGVRRIAWSRSLLGLEGYGSVEEGEYTVGEITYVLSAQQERVKRPQFDYMLKYPVISARGPGAEQALQALLARSPALSQGPDGTLVPARATAEAAERVVGRRDEADFTVFVNSGYHDQNEQGIFVLYGPEVQAGGLEPVDTVDVAPTALWLMGLAVPEDLDGEPVVAALTEEGRGRRPVKSVPTVEDGERPWAQGVSPGLSEKGREQLKELGYIE